MFSAQWATALCTGLKAKQYRWLSPILHDDNCTKARCGNYVKLVETGWGPHLNILCDWIHKFLSWISWSLWATASWKVVQVHREIQQRSPISGSRRPSITSMLSSTIGNTSLIAAQVDFDQILWKLGQIFCFDFVCCFLKRRCEHFKFREGGGKLLKPGVQI